MIAIPSVVLWWAMAGIFVGTPLCFALCTLDQRGLWPASHALGVIATMLAGGVIFLTAIGWLLAFGVAVGT